MEADIAAALTSDTIDSKSNVTYSSKQVYSVYGAATSKIGASEMVRPLQVISYLTPLR